MNPSISSIDEPVAGLNAKQTKWLDTLGVRTRGDLLFYLPRRYEDRTNFKPLSEALDGEWLVMRGSIRSTKTMRWRGGRRVFEAMLTAHATSETLRCRWYNLYYLNKLLVKDREIVLFGKLTRDKAGWLMTQPEFEVVEEDAESFIHFNRITPIYPLAEGVPQRGLRRLMYEMTRPEVVHCPEIYPAPADLMPLQEAIPVAHFPISHDEQRRAIQRLAYDEFFYLQCVVVRRRFQCESIRKPRTRVVQTALAGKFISSLPFQPTGAQQRVMEEIGTDMDRPVPMHRLLQGDVGSGKTLVAVYAMLHAVERGERAALMAPTEILAEQHYLNLQRWLSPLGIAVHLHTGSRKTLFAKTAESEDQSTFLEDRGTVIVGTHALLYESFAMERLGLIVIDEQHKFGVMQRLALVQKGEAPDILVMTATPIPRTLSMTLYGDLDVSILDELPPGRGEIITLRRRVSDLERVWEGMRTELAKGHQAYVVYPLIDESEKVDAKAVQAEYEHVRDVLHPYVTGLLHGRMKSDEKEQTMSEFRAGRIQALVSTPVIEVGVDVPNATVMVIESAERFGLAQLHQLRGRIGRGANRSFCILVGYAKSEEGWKRLKIMEETCDGFRIAEEDFHIRGPGDIFGAKQSGLPPLRVADLFRDQDLLQRARDDAEKVLRADQVLTRYPELRMRLARLTEQNNNLAHVG